MTIYIILFVSLCLASTMVYQNDPSGVSKREKTCCVLFAFAFIMIAALRGERVGTDTFGYINSYYNYGYFTYEHIFYYQSVNPGYYVLAKFFHDIGFSIQVWFALVATLYVGSVAKLIYRFSKNVTLSFIMFLTLGFYSFSLAGLKQTIAMAIVLYAFNFLYDKKYIRFFALLALSMFFHITSVIFAFSFIIVIMKKNRYIYFLLSVVFIVVMLNATSILESALGILGNDHYSEYIDNEATYSATTFIVFFSILAFSFLYFKSYADVNNTIKSTSVTKRKKGTSVADDANDTGAVNNAGTEAAVMYSMVYLGVISLIFAFVIASAFRLALYFTVFSIILVPNAIACEKDASTRSLLSFWAAVICILYFMYVNRNGGSVVPYNFYWENIEVY